MLILFPFPLICRLLLNRVDGQHEMANMQCMQMDLHHKLNLRCSTTKRVYTHAYAYKRKRLAHKVCFRHFYVFINCGKSFKTNFDTYKKKLFVFLWCALLSTQEHHCVKMNEKGESKQVHFSWNSSATATTVASVTVFKCAIYTRYVCFFTPYPKKTT